MWIPQLPRQPWSPGWGGNHGAETEAAYTQGVSSQTQCCWAPVFLWPFPLLLENWSVEVQQQTSSWPFLGPPGPLLPVFFQGVMLCRLWDIPPMAVTKQQSWGASKCPFGGVAYTPVQCPAVYCVAQVLKIFSQIQLFLTQTVSVYSLMASWSFLNCWILIIGGMCSPLSSTDWYSKDSLCPLETVKMQAIHLTLMVSEFM